MRRVRYAVAASLDGYIASPKGEYDWIVADPEVDFSAIMSQYDTLLVGRRTFEVMVSAGKAVVPGMQTFVFSRTLEQGRHPGVTIVSDARQVVSNLQATNGKDIWLFGGGELFSSLAREGLVNTVEVALMPVLLGKGIPLAPNLAKQTKLTLLNHKLYKSGIVSLQYACA
jgi:dihydrofolate reductase